MKRLWAVLLALATWAVWYGSDVPDEPSRFRDGGLL